MVSPVSSAVPASRPVDAVALARHRRRLHAADAPPWLHGEVARRMAERLAVIRLQPRSLLDWGAFVGASEGVLAAAYPSAARRRVETEAPRPKPKRAWWRAAFQPEAAVATPAELPAGAAQLVWCNMGLQAWPDPQALFADWHRVLAVDGFLMFSTLGPGTLTTLAALFAEAGWGPALAPLVDMHDLGDQLVQAGFADPVMDQETLTLTWPDAAAALAELRALGGNAARGRAPGLRTPRWRRRLEDALQRRAGADGRIALEFEIVYGHAFRPPPRPRVAQETAVPLDDLRAMVRRPPRP